MVLCAGVLAIGPFRRALVSHYEYPEGHYSNTKDGAPVVREMFGIIEGTGAGTDFARMLGISDPWDFNQHKITAHDIDFPALRSFLSQFEYREDYLRDLDALQAFATEGYDLYFLPHG
jgi:hypothetical protein